MEMSCETRPVRGSRGRAWTMATGFALAGFALAVLASGGAAAAEAARPITLAQALQRVLANNPRLTAADRDVGIASGKSLQAGVLPNPELSYELDNAEGSGPYVGMQLAESTLQLSQLIELPGKRNARMAAGTAGVDSAVWQQRATRLEVLSEATIAFIMVVSAQRRIQIYDEQIAGLDRLVPFLQKRVEEGATSPAETLRAQVTADLFRVDRERVKSQLATARRDLAILMNDSSPRFGDAVGRLGAVGRPPAFQSVVQSIDANPQLVRWTAITAQRNAELLLARLGAVPDPRVWAGWRYFRDTNDSAVRVGVSMPLPIFDQNTGNILAAEKTLEKASAERAINKAALIAVAGRAYDALTGAVQELKLLRSTIIPNAIKAVDTMESGYRQGRFTLLELLDMRGSAAQAQLREQEALQNFHVAVATIEGLVGTPLAIAREARR
jgi:outer membrane protein, heavy metal efflux system